MKKFKVLIIDDEKLIRWSLEKQISAAGFKIFTAESAEEGIKLHGQHLPDIVFIDNKLPGMQGVDAIVKLKSIWFNSYIVFMTAHGAIDIAVQAMKNGASEYLNKPFNSGDISALLSSISKKLDKTNPEKTKQSVHKDDVTFNDIIGSSPVIKHVIQAAKKISGTGATTVLLLGESGTGKDLFARAIHNESERKNKPFVTINCATLPGTLLESELFGHEKGAFTDARAQKKGLFEVAEGGTVFLDEIGEIDHSTQVKLLGVLENRKIRRVGGTADIPVEIRIIAATNRNLKQSIEQKTFREDLYYRLQVFQITMPALRDHKDDVPELAKHFFNHFNQQFNKNLLGISADSLSALCMYNWPGNIRELRNAIERAVILESGDVLLPENLPAEIIGLLSQSSVGSNANTDASLYDIEKQTIVQALEKAEGNQSKAARILGITRDTMRYKMKKHNLSDQ